MGEGECIKVYFVLCNFLLISEINNGTYNYCYPQVTYSYHEVTHSGPKVTHSVPKVTLPLTLHLHTPHEPQYQQAIIVK